MINNTDVMLFQAYTRNKKLRIPGLGVNYLAASLRSSGIRAEVLNTLQYYVDQNQDERILQRIREYKPKIVGISSISLTNKELIRISDMIRLCFPDMLIVVGGYGPTARRSLIESASIDVIVRGEGESTLREVAEGWLKGRDISSIKGTICKKGGTIVDNGQSANEELDLLPFPIRDIIDDSPLNRKDIMITARGCPFSCSFCAIPDFYSNGKRWRERPTANIVQEIDFLVRNHGLAGYIEFYDDEFLIRGERLDEIVQDTKEFVELVK